MELFYYFVRYVFSLFIELCMSFYLSVFMSCVRYLIIYDGCIVCCVLSICYVLSCYVSFIL